MRLLLLGATGFVGSSALKQALSNDAFSEVIAPTRKPLAPNARLVNPVMPRIEEFASALKSCNVDAVVCALGTTRAKAGSKQAFRYVDYELPVAFGKAAHGAGVGTYAIVTAMGASVDSMIFYSRTKGEVERDIRRIVFRSLTICRPGLIGGERNEARLAEKVALTLTRLLAPVLPRKLQVNPADTIAAALLDAVIDAKIGCRWINAEQMS
jgi:uncharacterized protein YbjT (DUF2867 family)